MAITFPVATKNTRANAVVDAVDVGTLNVSGQLWLKNSGNNVLSKHVMANPAFGAASAGSAVANAIANGTGLLAGSATKFDVVDRDENVIFSGTVGTVGSGSDLDSTSSSVTIAVGEVVVVSSLTYVEAS